MFALFAQRSVSDEISDTLELAVLLTLSERKVIEDLIDLGYMYMYMYIYIYIYMLYIYIHMYGCTYVYIYIWQNYCEVRRGRYFSTR